jgi:predicted PurR-regulated permease PerM
VQRQAVSLPPAVTLFAVVAFGLLFGPLGVLFATPLAVVALVAVKKLWVREALGEPVAVPGEE